MQTPQKKQNPLLVLTNVMRFHLFLNSGAQLSVITAGEDADRLMLAVSALEQALPLKVVVKMWSIEGVEATYVFTPGSEAGVIVEPLDVAQEIAELERAIAAQTSMGGSGLVTATSLPVMGNRQQRRSR